LQEETLTKGAKALGIELSREQVEQFFVYTQLLLEWNEKFNLTSIIDPEQIAIKHHLDSLTCLAAAHFPKGALVADIGTGAGFPGIPLAIVRPDLKLVLVEATKKKLSFLEEVAKEVLPGRNIELVNARAEELGHDSKHRERYDIVIARAVAEMRILAEYCLPLVKKGGLFIAMKGPDVRDEIKQAKPGIGTLGGSLPDITQLTLPFTDINRTLITIKKLKLTPEQFPRHGSKISKKPL
jgi:16S rRNA (guanine527-N7)-methyltransferase